MGSDTTIEALALEGFDRPPEVIDVPAPQPAAGEVLVRVHAASVNAFDSFVAMGMARAFMPLRVPRGDRARCRGRRREPSATASRSSGPATASSALSGPRASCTTGRSPELATPLAPALALTPAAVDDGQVGSLGVAGTTAMSAVDAIDPSRECDSAHRRGDGRRRNLRDPARGRSRRAA